MNCIKHGGGIPCKICMQEELVRCERENDELLARGQKVKHDLSALKEELFKRE